MSKKLLLNARWLLLLLLCCSVGSTFFVNKALAPAEKVVNGGFETGDLTGWTVEVPPQFDGDVTSTTSHSGTYCLRLGEVDFIHQAFAPSVGTTDDLSFWAKCDVGATLNPLGVIVYYSDGSSTSQGFWPTVGVWSQYTLSVDHVKLVSQIRFTTWEMQFPPPIYYYIDDVSLLDRVPMTFQDGFESGSFGAWTGTSSTLGEMAAVVNAMAHHGFYSAKFSSNGNLGTERAYCYKTVTSSVELYARGYFRVGASGIADNDDRFYSLVFKAGTNPVAFAGWRMTGGIAKWNLIIRDGTGWPTAYSTTIPSLNQWYCVELHWKKDATAGIGELWVDGTKVCSVTGKNTAYYGDVNRVEDGLPEIVKCAATTVYSDCVKLSNAYIGPEPTTTMFADGFESGGFSSWTGTSATSGETKAVTSALKHHGTYSANFASNGNLGTERTYSYKTVTSSSELYARGYFRVATSGISANDNRFYLLIFKGGGSPVAFAGWRRTGGVLKWNLLIRSGTGWATDYSISGPSLNQWYSVELHWKKDAANGLGELFVDGALVCSLTGRNTTAYGNVDRLECGLPEIVNCASTTAYCDCVKVATVYVGPET